MNDHTPSEASSPDLAPPAPASAALDDIPTSQGADTGTSADTETLAGTGAHADAPADSSESGTSQSADTETMSTQATSSQPTSSEPASPQAATSEPHTSEPGNSEPGTSAPDIDLDAIEHDLNDVQAALERLNDGSYWTDEVTGETIQDDVLAAFPLTRTVATASTGDTRA